MTQPKDTQNEAKQRVLEVHPEAHEYFDGVTYWVWKTTTIPKLCLAAGSTSRIAWEFAASKLTPTVIGPICGHCGSAFEWGKRCSNGGWCNAEGQPEPTAIPAQEAKSEIKKNLSTFSKWPEALASDDELRQLMIPLPHDSAGNQAIRELQAWRALAKALSSPPKVNDQARERIAQEWVDEYVKLREELSVHKMAQEAKSGCAPPEVKK